MDGRRRVHINDRPPAPRKRRRHERDRSADPSTEFDSSPSRLPAERVSSVTTSAVRNLRHALFSLTPRNTLLIFYSFSQHPSRYTLKELQRGHLSGMRV